MDVTAKNSSECGRFSVCWFASGLIVLCQSVVVVGQDTGAEGKPSGSGLETNEQNLPARSLLPESRPRTLRPEHDARSKDVLHGNVPFAGSEFDRRYDQFRLLQRNRTAAPAPFSRCIRGV